MNDVSVKRFTPIKDIASFGKKIKIGTTINPDKKKKTININK